MVVRRRYHEVSSVDKQIGVNTTNFIQLTSRGCGNGSYIGRSSPDLRAKFALINVRSIRKKSF